MDIKVNLLEQQPQSRAVQLIGASMEIENIIRETKKRISFFHMRVLDECDKTLGNDLVSFTAFEKAVKKMESDIDNAFREFIAAKALFAEDEKIRFEIPRCEK